MSARLPGHALDEVAQKWRALAERRRAHFLELYHSEAQFLQRMREAIRLSERWAAIAPSGANDSAAEQARPVADAPRRTAA